MDHDDGAPPRDPVSVLVALARAGGREVTPAERELLGADTLADGQVTSLLEVVESAMSPLDAHRRAALAAGLRAQGGALAQVVDAHDGALAPATESVPGPTEPPPPPLVADVSGGASVAPDPAPADQQTSPTPPPSPSRGRGRARRWTALVVVVAVVGAASLLGWRNYRAGVRWQQVAVAAQADVDELRETNEQLAGDLDEVTESLRRSEIDVGGLERRLANVANEKARVEDEREQAKAMTERIAEIAMAYEDVAQWFQACRQDQTRLTQMALDLDAYVYAGQGYLVEAQVDAVVETCATAEGRLADLRGYVDALARG